MRAVGLLAAVLMVLVAPAVAQAGTVTRDAATITYRGSDKEGITLGIEAGQAFVSSERGVTSSTCTQTDPNRVDCVPTPAFAVFFGGFDDGVSADAVSNGATLEAHGGAGDDTLSGTPNNDALYGDDGGDRIFGGGGNDTLVGGPGENSFEDGAGNDTISGGPNNDLWRAGPGSDSFAGGDGQDSVEYNARSAPVTVTLDGQADDGEAGEGDNVAADVENVTGGQSNDRIVGGPNGAYLYGLGGNDTITGTPQEDRVEGNEGDDTIDTRDGRFDSIDCGPGTDTLLADPGDSQTGCEIAPDRDGDGTLNEQDCQPDNPAVHPGAGEIVGNNVDEDCAGGPAYFRVESGLSWRFANRSAPARIRFTTLRASDVRPGDRIEIRCKGKGCPFTKKTIVVPAGASSLNLVPRFKKRFLGRGTVIDVRNLRANFLGKVFQLRVVTRDIRQTRLCLAPGATAPARCS